MSQPPLVLVTGAGGRIGRAFITRNAGRMRFRVAEARADSLEPVRAFAEGRPLVFDVQDAAACREAVRGVDAVVHLAAAVDPWTQDLHDIAGPNLMGAYEVFNAAALEPSCRRLVFASSAQVVEAYPKDVQLGTSERFRPANLYGVCKVFAEALAAYHAARGDYTAVCLRIASFRETLTGQTRLSKRDVSAYLSPRDLAELMARAVEVTGITFEVCNAVSNNRYKRLRMDETCALLGVELKDDAFEALGYPPPAEVSDPAFERPPPKAQSRPRPQPSSSSGPVSG